MLVENEVKSMALECCVGVLRGSTATRYIHKVYEAYHVINCTLVTGRVLGPYVELADYGLERKVNWIERLRKY